MSKCNKWCGLLASLNLFYSTTVWAETGVDKRISDCLNRGLQSLLTARGVSDYAAITNITRNVVGPAWRQLDDQLRGQLEATVLLAMEKRLHEKGAEFRDAVVTAEKLEPSSRYPNFYQISGTISSGGQPYWFETQATISKRECRFYTLNIENYFILSAWLRDQASVKAKMKELGLK